MLGIYTALFQKTSSSISYSLDIVQSVSNQLDEMKDEKYTVAGIEEVFVTHQERYEVPLLITIIYVE